MGLQSAEKVKIVSDGMLCIHTVCLVCVGEGGCRYIYKCLIYGLACSFFAMLRIEKRLCHEDHLSPRVSFSHTFVFSPTKILKRMTLKLKSVVYISVLYYLVFV